MFRRLAMFALLGLLAHAGISDIGDIWESAPVLISGVGLSLLWKRR